MPIGRIASDVKPADPLDRDNPATLQKFRRRNNGIDGLQDLAIHGMYFEGRSADIAAVGLGMEPAIPHILELGCAVSAHFKTSHRRPAAVVRRGLDDGIPGTAISTVYEREMVAPVRWAREFFEALTAHGNVRRKLREPLRGHAFADLEFLVVTQGQNDLRDFIDPRGRRLELDQPIQESRQSGRRSLGFDVHAGRGVADKTGKTEIVRRAVHKRPETHALDNTLDVDPQPFFH
jgi:hypothetical protein